MFFVNFVMGFLPDSLLSLPCGLALPTGLHCFCLLIFIKEAVSLEAPGITARFPAHFILFTDGRFLSFLRSGFGLDAGLDLGSGIQIGSGFGWAFYFLRDGLCFVWLVDTLDSGAVRIPPVALLLPTPTSETQD